MERHAIIEDITRTNGEIIAAGDGEVLGRIDCDGDLRGTFSDDEKEQIIDLLSEYWADFYCDCPHSRYLRKFMEKEAGWDEESDDEA